MQRDFIDEISRELHLPYKYINGHEYRVRNCDLHGFVSIKDIQKTQNLNILNFFSNNFFDDDVEIDYVVSNSWPCTKYCQFVSLTISSFKLIIIENEY